MKTNASIHEAICFIQESLKSVGLAPGTLRNYETYFNSFETYLNQNGITHVDEDICLEYIHVKTGKRLDAFATRVLDPAVSRTMMSLHLLLMYQKTGEFRYHQRWIQEEVACPACFAEEFAAFMEECAYRGYASATMKSNRSKVLRFLNYLITEGSVCSSSEITLKHAQDFILCLKDYSVKYIGIFLYVLRNYFSFLYEKGYAVDDFSVLLPKIRTARNSSIPHIWPKEDILKLLDAVDREDPKGKRDYALLLLAIRLGLRISDIRGMKLSSLNWNRKVIQLRMKKTGQDIELPLLDDIGWAIIDYLKNGRPKTTSDTLFVRHRPPFNSLGEQENFNRELHRYVIKAGLDIPANLCHGMHSLRNTLARNMLDIKAPLPIISETLGHQDINTTSIYLKVDINGLRKCALDLEEVLSQ